ncbi:hypothetical protein LA430_16030 [Lactiplantibacillus plantarum]|uniref:DUF7004 family protein n=1 Tax=Lactiplantibacillus plantarum TaxID=1590 RepID=UPI001E392E25|nr:hypothetical protein [Lactiplantibacillus plantarum]MCC6117983.1 hypothetical protein [Lactiplantibacillus plantarum]MCW6115530.1 hypothetical protein [Lactiplantibacillus plantarum]
MSYGDHRRVLIEFEDGTNFNYSEGHIDHYHLMFFNGQKDRDLKDAQYFQALKNYGLKYGQDYIYQQFVKIVKMVARLAQKDPADVQPQQQDFGLIAQMVHTSVPDNDRLFKLYVCFYLAMISEWHYHDDYRRSKLHHRLKHLGVYQLLKLNWSAKAAANFSRHKTWQQLDAEMKKYGI